MSHPSTLSRGCLAQVGRRVGFVVLPGCGGQSGAVALDNGRGSAVTLMMLIGCLAVMGYVIARVKTLSPGHHRDRDLLRGARAYC